MSEQSVSLRIFGASPAEVAERIASAFPEEIAVIFPEGPNEEGVLGLDVADDDDSRGYVCKSKGPRLTEIWSDGIWLLGPSEEPFWAREGWTVWERALFCKGIEWQHRKLWHEERLIYLETLIDRENRMIQFNGKTVVGPESDTFVERSLCFLSRSLGAAAVVLDGYGEPAPLPLPAVLEPRSARFAVMGQPSEEPSQSEPDSEDVPF